MNRREELENIIIGTLLESNKERNYFDECKGALTADMFLDNVNRRIYTIISEMNAKGNVETDPCTIYKEYDFMVLDILPRMMELCADYSFIHKKTEYNERRFLESCINGTEYKRADVHFEDYVNQFLKIVFYEERKAG